MRDEIVQKLHEIEEKENVKIIYAVEAGSRAWGFAGSNSDYDVRFIYVREKNDYLRLDAFRDVLEYPVNNLLDISGWDISKTLRLVYNSNPALFEWINSPIIYIDENIDELKELTKKYFSKSKIVNHYFNIAKGHFDKYINLKTEVIIKKYFYVIRGILAADYVLKYSDVPPVEFDVLREKCLSNELNKIVDELLDIKINCAEAVMIKREETLDKYIENKFKEIDVKRKQIKDDEKKDWQPLNKYFLKVIEGDNIE